MTHEINFAEYLQIKADTAAAAQPSLVLRSGSISRAEIWNSWMSNKAFVTPE